jgi:hypothetical protein
MPAEEFAKVLTAGGVGTPDQVLHGALNCVIREMPPETLRLHAHCS